MAEASVVSDAVEQAVLSASLRLSDQLAEVELGLANAAVDSQTLVDSILQGFLARVGSLELVGRSSFLPSAILWRVAGDRLSKGWLQNRAREKPRGFAGDHELLGRIIRLELCTDPLGQLFDSFFQRTGAPEAVRNRSEIIAAEIVRCCRTATRLQRMTIVGCGPALDVQAAARQLSEVERSRLRFQLLDYDPLAIDEALSRLDGVFGRDQLHGDAAALFRIPQRPKLAEYLTGSDLLIAAGMFDYLESAAASAMLGVFWERLAPGGKLLVFNFSPTNSSRSYMEWFGNWYLLHRTEQDLRDIAVAAGIPTDSVRFGAEPLGIDIWLSAIKPG